ncbi:MAG: hypothetical protein GXX83_06120 [Gaiellales bacterium]|nr:hypothetical protein [Gaiellales bacterium]
MKMSRVGAAIFAIAAVVLLVLSVIERDAGLLWMPVLHIVGWLLLLVATALATYNPVAAEAARSFAQGEVAKEAEAKRVA